MADQQAWFAQSMAQECLGLQGHCYLKQCQCWCLQQSALSLEDGILCLAAMTTTESQSNLLIQKLHHFALASARFRAKMRTSNIHQCSEQVFQESAKNKVL